MAATWLKNDFGKDVKLENPEIVKKLSEGNLEFSLNLYKAITKSQGDGTNAFFSPLSITVALSMLCAGARKNTAAELRETLHLDVLKEDTEVHAAFKDILKALTPSTMPFDLHMANRIYVEESYSLAASYLATLTDSYLAKAVTVSFKKDAEKARNEINSYVDQVTKHNIKDLLAAGILNKLTRMVLINAIYFKGTWKFMFNRRSSHEAPFFKTNDDQISVMMMHFRNMFSFARLPELECKILQLPYSGDRLSMILILPDRIEGLAELEASLTAETFRFLVSSLSKSRDVQVTLPKFKLELETALKPILQDLGIKEAFKEFVADLTGISDSSSDSSPDMPLYVSSVIHKAFVMVNEEGTEAAAATGVSNEVAHCQQPQPLVFRADHPFLFAIYDNLTKMVLFLGRLADPPGS